MLATHEESQGSLPGPWEGPFGVLFYCEGFYSPAKALETIVRTLVYLFGQILSNLTPRKN